LAGKKKKKKKQFPQNYKVEHDTKGRPIISPGEKKGTPFSTDVRGGKKGVVKPAVLGKKKKKKQNLHVVGEGGKVGVF